MAENKEEGLGKIKKPLSRLMQHPAMVETAIEAIEQAGNVTK
jgi:hypothetical protein